MDAIPIEPQTSGEPQALGVLKADVAELKTEVARLKTDAVDPWKKMGLFVAVVGGILGMAAAFIGLPKGVKEANEVINARPNTQISVDALAVFYNPNRSAFVARVPITISNQGNKTDHVNNPYAKITAADGRFVGVDKSNIYVYEKGNLEDFSLPSEIPLSLPYSVTPGYQGTVISSILFDSDVFQSPGEQVLEFSFSDESRTVPSTRLCFYIDSQQVRELRGKEYKVGKRWISPKCKSDK